MIRITIPIIPVGQQRARATIRGGHASVYKSAKQRHEENALMAHLAQHVPSEPMQGPVELEFVAHLPVPASKPKKWKDQALSGEIRPTGKPDMSNIVKHLEDCLNTMLYWEDDKQVVRLVAEKRYSDSPRWEIEIKAA